MNEELTEMKEYMQTLMDVKVSLTQLNGKVDNIADMKGTIEKLVDTATAADNRSRNNEKDIMELNVKTDGIINNDRKKWGAIAAVISGFVFEIIYFLLTFRIK